MVQDPNMLFVVIRTKTAAASQKALEVSLGVTRYRLFATTSHMRSEADQALVRFRHREGRGDLHQYVVEEDPVRAPKPAPPTKGPKVINLDDR